MRLRKAVVVLFCLAAVFGLGFALWKVYLFSQRISYDEHFSGAVKDPVSIERDASGNPVIHAASVSDAWFAIGYCQALDRLPVLEFRRALALGNARQVLKGEDAVMMTRLAAVLGIVSDAETAVSRLDPPHRALLDSFAAGINKGKRRHGRSLITKDSLLRQEWTARDLVAVALMDSWVHSLLFCKEMQFAIPEKKMFPALDDFIPHDAVFTYKEKHDALASTVLSLRRLLVRAYGGREDYLSVFIPPSDGSKELFAFCTFKPQNVFPSAMNAVVEIGGVRYLCITRAGSPFIISSVSDSLRVSAFPMSIDSVDLYLLPVESRSGVDSYQAESEWKPFVVNASSDGGRLRRTDFGPVISDISVSSDSGFCVALRGIVFTEKTVSSLLDLPFARSVDEANLLVRGYEGEPFLVFFSDAKRSSVCPAGKIAARAPGGFFFRERSVAPFMTDLSSFRRDFGAGRAVCTSVPSAKEYPQLADAIPAHPDRRSQRVLSLLEGEWTRDSLFEAVGSPVSEFDEQTSKKFVKLLEGAPITSAKLCRMYLAGWDGAYSADAKAPLIFNQMAVSFLEETLSDELGDDIGQIFENQGLIADRLGPILDKGDSKAFDNVKTPDSFETFDTVFNQSFIRAMRYLHRWYGPEMDRWTWARVHTPGFDIPLVRTGFPYPTAQQYPEKRRYAARVYSGSVAKDFLVRETAHDACIVSGGSFFLSSYPVSCSRWSAFSAYSESNNRTDDMSQVKAVSTAAVSPAAQ